MTLPRKVLPGTTYFITRRTAQRLFFLRPAARIKQAMGYGFGRALENYPGIELHSLSTLSDHYHSVLTDKDGSLPEFMAWVNRETACALNVHYDRAEALWSSERYSAVELVDEPALWDKLIYTFTNPVKHRLVRYARDWPGLCSTPRDWLRAEPERIERPDFYFNQREESRASVELRYTIPPQLRDRDPDLLVRDLQAAIEDRERQYLEQARREGKGFLGAERALAESPFATPKTRHLKGKLNPRFAAGTAEGQQRAREERKSFLSAYREAFELFRQGLDCIFPAGSYLWPRLCAAACAPLETGRCAMNSS